jgi:hypothetical protein
MLMLMLVLMRAVVHTRRGGASGAGKIVVDPGLVVDPVHYDPPFPPRSPNQPR